MSRLLEPQLRGLLRLPRHAKVRGARSGQAGLQGETLLQPRTRPLQPLIAGGDIKAEIYVVYYMFIHSDYLNLVLLDCGVIVVITRS